MKTSPKILLSGGGTGGHIFPAVAIADEIKKRIPEAEFLFIGAQDKMEMQKVPAAGYEIKGLKISGISRDNMLANLSFPFKLINSIYRSNQYISTFKPDLAIGTGGFASGPALWTSSKKGVPIFLQEQNSYPGITNKLLKNKAKKIFVAYDEMGSYFPENKMYNLGNPIRQSLFDNPLPRNEARAKFGLAENKLTILSVGGSLGSRTLNQAWIQFASQLNSDSTQLLWQTGSLEYEAIQKEEAIQLSNVIMKEFIQDMGSAYQAADIIVSRAGAIAISELCVASKATILVPFPYAAEDHQTKNAENLRMHHAAIMVKDSEVKDRFWTELSGLINDAQKRETLAKNIHTLAKPNATQHIVDEILKSVSLS